MEDIAHITIKPCIGCKSCAFSGLPCSLNRDDNMLAVKGQILNADMLIFVTPLYYFGMSAQLKACLDRCCAISRQITEKRMKAALIAAAWNDDDWTRDAIGSHYKTLCRYMDFEDKGMILGIGCGTVEATAGSVFPQMAYQIAKEL